mmetsp:Transcript_27023/g.84457  ORF Transcript_27023/g.84457 Transcript_27023/m.84457 type:complete len:387 (+) Transcript_27023:38-1198(+)
MQGADNDVADDVSPLAHWRAEVGAEVAHTEESAGLVLADEHVVAGDGLGHKLPRRKLACLDADLDPLEGGQDLLGGVAGCRQALRQGAGRGGPRGAAQGRHGRLAGLGALGIEAAEEGHAAGDHVVGRQGGDADHGKAPILQLLQLHLLEVKSGFLRQLEGVETQVAGLAVHLADPRVARVPTALHDHGEHRNLDNAQGGRLVGIAGGQGFGPVGLHRQARDVCERLHDGAHKGQHADTAMLHLGLAQPLHVRVGHDHVEVEVAIVELAEAHGVPRLITHLDVGPDHGQHRLLAARHGLLGVDLPVDDGDRLLEDPSGDGRAPTVEPRGSACDGKCTGGSGQSGRRAQLCPLLGALCQGGGCTSRARRGLDRRRGDEGGCRRAQCC